MAKQPSGIAADIAAMKALGMTDAEIRGKLVGAPVATVVAGEQPPQTAQARQDAAVLGPDPETVARHQAFLATYRPPVLEETFEVTLDKRRADYVRRWAGWQSAQRKGEVITPERAIDLMIRRLWQLDPDRASIGGPGTGVSVPRSHFTPPPSGDAPAPRA